MSLTSSWGNGHATTYRALLQALARRGHDLVFLEQDVPWYRAHRDLPDPDYAKTLLYRSPDDLRRRFADVVRSADAVVVGSFVAEGVAVAQWALATAKGPVLFYDIDTPVTLDAMERGACSYLAPGLVPRFATYLSFTGGPLLQRLESRWGAQRAVALYCAADPDGYRPQGEREERYDLGYLGTYSADRQPTLERLLIEPARHRHDRRFVVGGPQYPPEVAWAPNVERVEHVPPHLHPSFYQGQAFTLNVTRAAMRGTGWAPSVRLFEAAATATPVLTDTWPGLEAFFTPGKEILPVEDTADVLRCLDAYDAGERRRIGAAARERVLSAHTPDHRARTVEDVVAPLLEGTLPDA